MGWKLVILALMSLMLLAMSGVAYADRPEVDIEAPDYVRPGKTVQVIVEVEHEDSTPGITSTS